MISGEYGPTFEVCVRAADRMQGAQRYVLDSYEALGWSDVAADRAAEVATSMKEFLGRFTADMPRSPAREGNHAGISYRIEGSGPALLLLPFFLAPSQWAPAIPELARDFTVVTLGGRHLGGIAALGDRARMPTYRAMFRTLIDLIAPQPGEAILDIGCGAGSLDRLLAQRTAGANPITAIDMNPFWLREAEALAAEEGLAGAIRFLPGNAEAVPFPDGSFDAVFSVTVLEECDADRAIGEMIRVARPGGRIGIIVRAVDLPQWWNLDLPEPIRRKVTPPRSEEHTSELQSHSDLVCRLLLEKKKSIGHPSWNCENIKTGPLGTTFPDLSAPAPCPPNQALLPTPLPIVNSSPHLQ